jgi:Ca-activated chloride channel family protein
MYATDIAPNRLTRSRYKAIDLLEQLNEGGIGLIAYAGDAFTISPLTDDINNIKLLLPSLSPELMPELGSNPLAALTLAHDMLVNAGHSKGDIYWFTDGIDNYDIQDITDWSRSNNHRLNILGIGTSAGAPIKLNNGELQHLLTIIVILKRYFDNPVMLKINNKKNLQIRVINGKKLVPIYYFLS